MIDAGASEEPGRPRHLLWTTACFWSIAFACVLVSSRSGLHSDFFFDEAWRSDVIRSSRPFATMRTIDTPIPPLWPWLLHLSTSVVGGRFFGLRLQGAALAALCPALAGQLARVLLPARAGRGPAWTRGLLIGSVATIATAACLDGSSVTTYFNDYAFQGALVLALVLVMYLVDREWLPIWTVLPALVLLSVGTLSGLFVLPVVAWWALQPQRRAHRTLLVSGLAVSGVLATGLYLGLYRHRVDKFLTDFWADDLLRHGSRSVVGTFVHLVRTAGVFVDPSVRTDLYLIPLGLCLLGLAVTGFVTLRAQWPWLGRMGISAWGIAALASIAVDWPVTTVRVNVPFLSLWIVAAVVGLWHLAHRCSASFGTAMVVAVVAVVAIVNVPEQFHRNELFAKGLDADMQPIRDSTAAHILVVGYHFMSFPYLHDGLVNRRDGAGRYRFIQDTLADPLDDRDLPALVTAERLQPGDEVWCVVPFEVGPAVAVRACVLDAPEYEPISSTRGVHSLIIGYRVTGHR